MSEQWKEALRLFLLEVEDKTAAEVDKFFPRMLAAFNSPEPRGPGWRRGGETPSPLATEFAYIDWARKWLEEAGCLAVYDDA